MARKTAEEDLDALDLEDEDFEVEEDEETKAKGKKGSKKDDTPKGISASQMAEHLGTDPKTFRAWLRRKLAAEELSTLDDHEHKARYDFGSSLKTNASRQVIALWEADHAESDEEEEEKPKKKTRKKKSS